VLNSNIVNYLYYHVKALHDARLGEKIRDGSHKPAYGAV